MQRILSVETSRSANTSTEFVSKRFCFSILFSIAFLFLLAGYLLGRYTTDRAILLRQAYVRQKLSLDEKNPMDILKNISESVKSINQVTLQRPADDIAAHIYEELLCQKKTEFPTLEVFKEDVNLMISKILTRHLELLSTCYSSVDNLLQSVPTNGDK